MKRLLNISRYFALAAVLIQGCILIQKDRTIQLLHKANASQREETEACLVVMQKQDEALKLQSDTIKMQTNSVHLAMVGMETAALRCKEMAEQIQLREMIITSMLHAIRADGTNQTFGPGQMLLNDR